MTRLIDANALKETINAHDYVLKDCLNTTDKGVFTVGIMQAIDAQPTVDAEPVRHGKWKWLSCTYDRVPKEKEYVCSECHHKTIVHGDDMPWEKYCPNCGCRMDKDD